MNSIPVIDTHNLPYPNARITAKRAQSGDTTPVQFYDGSDEPLGYTLRTNAKGFLCDSAGAILVGGAFLHEDCVVTAVMGDGATSSWTVKQSIGTPVNDGMLYGRDAMPGEEFIVVNGVRKKLLHSANDSRTRKLSLSDLDSGGMDIEPWSEMQQVHTLSLPTLSEPVLVNKYTKTLLFKWDGPAPSQDFPVNVTLKVSTDPQRYAQHVMVYNIGPYRLTLKDFATGTTVGNVNPLDGTLNIGCFYVEDSSTGIWFEDEDRLDFDSKDSSSGPDTTVRTIGGSLPQDNAYHVPITDRTPGLLRIVAKELEKKPFPSLRYSAIPVMLDVNSTYLTKERKQKIQFINMDEEGLPYEQRELGTMPAMLMCADAVLGYLYPGEVMEIHMPSLAGRGTYGGGYYPVVVSNGNGQSHIASTVAKDARFIPVPYGCEHLYVNGTATPNSAFGFYFDPTDHRTVRFTFRNLAGPTLALFKVPGQAVPQFTAFISGTEDYVVLDNANGIIRPVGERDCYNVAGYQNRSYFDWIVFGNTAQQDRLVLDVSQYIRKFNASPTQTDVIVDLTHIVPIGASNVKLEFVLKGVPDILVQGTRVPKNVMFGHPDMDRSTAYRLTAYCGEEYHVVLTIARTGSGPNDFVVTGEFV